jgi:hypothetical protein
MAPPEPQPDDVSLIRLDRSKLAKFQHQRASGGIGVPVTSIEYELVPPTKGCIKDIPEEHDSPIYDAVEEQDNSRSSKITGFLFNVILTVLPLLFIGTVLRCQR